jgi:hypothetical protein
MIEDVCWWIDIVSNIKLMVHSILHAIPTACLAYGAAFGFSEPIGTQSHIGPYVRSASTLQDQQPNAHSVSGPSPHSRNMPRCIVVSFQQELYFSIYYGFGSYCIPHDAARHRRAIP